MRRRSDDDHLDGVLIVERPVRHDDALFVLGLTNAMTANSRGPLHDASRCGVEVAWVPVEA